MTDFSELTDVTNIKILKSIISDPKNLTNIANDLKISRPEISRRLTKLRKISLVEKEEDGNTNSITPLGGLLLEILSPLDFILQHYSFFQTHSLFNFPSELLYGIHYLKQSILITGTGASLQKYVSIAIEHHTDLKLMANSPIPNVAKVIYDNSQFITPSIPSSSPETIHEHLSKETKKYELRKLPDINYDITILEDRFGFIYFPDNTGVPDNNYCFYVEDEDGIKFLLQLWDYFWKNAIKFLQST